jgi:diaminohydroxyphosphoribosylaminopyrimidine deaminase/5-amino-6-(5-phosphoribosylamino)uracil reductase
VTRPGNDPDRLKAYRGAGVEVLEVPDDDEGNLSLERALAALGGRGLNDVLVEGGGRIAAGLLRAGLVDRMVWFRAPRVIGGDGIPAAAGFGLERLDGAPGFERVAVERAGEDLVETYRRLA